MPEIKPTSCPEKSRLPKQRDQDARPPYLETQACWVLVLPTSDGSQHNPGVPPASSATKGYYCQALGKAETETEGERQHWGAQNKGVPSRPRDIFASWAHPLIRFHSLNKSNRLHSFSSHSCKAVVKKSAKKKREGPTDFRVERCKSRRLGAFTLSVSTSDPLGM